MSKRHPYVGLPDFQFWKKEKGIKNSQDFDPVTDIPFQINKQDKIVTAGSCFAQHVARYLNMSGFNHFITEKPHPIFDTELASKHNYGLFAARYGNIYTARQLKQLLLRSFNEFLPHEKAWTKSGNFVDPFRPQIQPQGFSSLLELEQDRKYHFASIRKAITEMSVFVFTLGLTEAWEDSRDGSVVPLSPGIAGGTYNEDVYKFVNFSLSQTREDLEFSLNYIRKINPSVKFIVTVSPVPLNATFETKHVFVSTTYSKSILRVAAEEVANTFEDCVYFPSYEIITSPYVRGKYFADDCRQVNEVGVSHVMKLFLKHFGDFKLVDSSHGYVDTISDVKSEVENYMKEMEEVIDVLCDEEMISNN